MVIDIRSTHGGGKSWIMHQLLTKAKSVPILGEAYGKPAQHLGYHLKKWDAGLLGKYETDCGGCDGIKNADEVVRRVKLFFDKYRRVLLEGILVSHTFERYNQLAQWVEDQGGKYLFCFINTPLDVCIKRVENRRKARGQDKPFNPKNVIKDHHTIYTKVFDKCKEAGRSVLELDWHDPLTPILKELSYDYSSNQ